MRASSQGLTARASPARADGRALAAFRDSGRSLRRNELSIRRAEAVRRVLVQRGIPEKRAMAVGLGEAQPVATNATVRGRAKNRRVELRIAMVKE